MWDFVAATVAGAFAGVFFEYYFRRHARLISRIPEATPAEYPDDGDVEAARDNAGEHGARRSVEEVKDP